MKLPKDFLFGCLFIILTFFALKWVQSASEEAEIKLRFTKRPIEIKPQNRLRGDYRVSFYQVPLDPLRWTVNVKNWEWISWQSKEKEGFFIRNLPSSNLRKGR